MCTSEIRHGGSLRSEADSHSQFSHKCHKRQDTKGTAPAGYTGQGQGPGSWRWILEFGRASAIKSCSIVSKVKLTITASATAPPTPTEHTAPHMRRFVSQNIMCWPHRWPCQHYSHYAWVGVCTNSGDPHKSKPQRLTG
jgi:hypothetical protein